MASQDLYKRLLVHKQYPKLAEILPQSEVIAYVTEVATLVETLKKAIETNKIKGEPGKDGYTPKEGTDYYSKAQVDAYLNQVLTDTLTTYEKNVTALMAKVEKRVSEIKDGIDAEITDDLKAEIAEMSRALIELPDFETLVATTITASPESIRDSLELLQDGDKLAISAIEDLDAIIDELRRRPHGTTGGGVRSMKFLNDVTLEGITDGQGIAWNATLGRFEPVTLGGGGAGSTYETPTGTVDGTNVTYTVSATPKCIIYFGTTLFEGANGYSRSGLTITMPYAPTVSDQFKAVI